MFLNVADISNIWRMRKSVPALYFNLLDLTPGDLFCYLSVYPWLNITYEDFARPKIKVLYSKEYSHLPLSDMWGYNWSSINFIVWGAHSLRFSVMVTILERQFSCLFFKLLFSLFAQHQGKFSVVRGFCPVLSQRRLSWQFFTIISALWKFGSYFKIFYPARFIYFQHEAWNDLPSHCNGNGCLWYILRQDILSRYGILLFSKKFKRKKLCIQI